ncbi:MAG: hypothetical protein K2Q32_02495 [Alphaproteobacteria bacterium]|nr:hypothetical protein [Alphaproteobacteria bacterium]
MSETNPDFKKADIGDFVMVFFPTEKNPGEPSRTPQCAMIVGIDFDDELKVPILKLALASGEVRSDLSTRTEFAPLARELSRRVRVSEKADRTITEDRVVALPLCARFFVDLIRHSHLKVIATTSMDEVSKILPRLSEPNMIALSVFRMEEQLYENDVRPTLLIDRQKTFQAAGSKLDPEPN